MMQNLDQYMVNECPNTVYYIPNFITEDEEQYLIRKVNDSPKPKWTQLKNRRLQNWGGIPASKGMIPEQIPDWLNTYCLKIADLNVFESNKPNHILINEYLPGQGIMPHEDGNLYYPTVTTISLGSHTFLDFYRPLSVESDEPTSTSTNKESNDESVSSYDKRYMFSLLIEPRSLLILRDDMYKTYLHGIKEINEDIFSQSKIANYKNLSASYTESSSLKRDTRISLTIRHVPKVLKLNSFSMLLNNKRN